MEAGWKADLKRMGFEVPVEELEKGEIVGEKWLAGGARPGFLGAKVFFVVAASPESVARKLLNLDPTQGKDLGWEENGVIKSFQKISRPPTSEDWARLRTALGKMPFETLLTVEGQKEGKYHLNAEEVKKISVEKSPGGFRFWNPNFRLSREGVGKSCQGCPRLRGRRLILMRS